MYDYNGQPIARYHFENAWPSKIEIGALKAGESEVLMETVTIVCEHPSGSHIARNDGDACEGRWGGMPVKTCR